MPEPGDLWTIGEALHALSPSPNRRTLQRWLGRLPSYGVRSLPQGGPPARLYREADVRQRHALWTRESTLSVQN